MATITAEELVARVRGGDRAALEELVGSVKDLVYNLALRMLGSPSDAEDACQEILIRLVANLDGFRGESAFSTWAYRVAANHLLRTRQRSEESRFASFEEMGDYLSNGVAADKPTPDDALLVQEAKLRCTAAMMLRLSRDERLAFMLGEVLDLAADEAAKVVEVTPEAFRKRLSRARARMAEFTGKTCGLVNPDAKCRCGKQAGNAVARGYLDKEKVVWAKLPTRQESKASLVNEVDEFTAAVAVLRSHPRYAAPDSIVGGLKELIKRGQNALLD